MKRLFLFFILMMVIPVLGIAGTAYYVDPTAPGGGNGSYANPWNNISQINAHTFSTGDSVYFKVNTTLVPNARFNLRWSGMSNNRVTIGAYHGNGQFGLRSGDQHPKIDGQITDWNVNNPPSHGGYGTDWDGQINLVGHHSYITIRDLEFTRLWNIGVKFHRSRTGTWAAHNQVINCRFIAIGRQAISVQGQQYAIVDGNYTDTTTLRGQNLARKDDDGNTYYLYTWGGAAIEIGGQSITGSSMHNRITNNTVVRAGEAIGLYNNVLYATVSGNTISDFVKAGLYMENGEYITIENNLVYQPGERWRANTTRLALIWLNSERWIAHTEKMLGYVTVRNNYLAGGSAGVLLTSNTQHEDVYPKHIRIYGNRIVDCDRNFLFNHNSSGWHDNHIYGNYSFIHTSGLVHTSHMSPAGVTWGISAEQGNDYRLRSTGMNAPNFFNTGVATVSGNAAKNAVFNQVSLIKERNWRSLKTGEVNRDWFKLTNEMQDQVPPPKVKNVIAAPTPK